MPLKRFPGFIDVHVHLREPGNTHKEDFRTGSRAALRGGFTFIIDMPNNVTPTISLEALNEKVKLSKEKALCDVGFHFGTNGKNTDSFKKIWGRPEVFGLKLYCNHTTGEMLIQDISLLESVFEKWNSNKPILVHAEGVELAAMLTLAHLYGRRLHVCHISEASEVELVRKAKQKKISVTAGVCPHHLYFTGDLREKKKGYAMMKPPLGTVADRDALWAGIADGTIDIVETDHAPHTKEEKERDQPVFGVPGLQSALGLMWKAVKEKKITEVQLVDLLYQRPKTIFSVPDQKDTYVELDPEKSYIDGEDGIESKCGWSLYEGMELYGKPETVVLRGKVLLKNGRIV